MVVSVVVFPLSWTSGAAVKGARATPTAHTFVSVIYTATIRAVASIDASTFHVVTILPTVVTF